MAYESASDLLDALGRRDSAAWTEFLVQFSSIIRQVIVHSVDDADSQADCFVFVCERLAEGHFRRLRRFDPAGSATFATWLRAVVRNLCVDWWRKNRGRFQAFKWTETLDGIDRQIFHCVYEKGCSIEFTLNCLRPLNESLTLEAVEAIAERLGARLSARERWLLSTRVVRLEPLVASDEGETGALEVIDLTPDPECMAIDSEYQAALSEAVRNLSESDQVLLRMRFEQDLTLSEMARISGLKDAQSVDRKLRAILDQVRSRMARFLPRQPGKIGPTSV